MNCALNLSAVGSVAALGFGVLGAVEAGNIALFIGFPAVAGYEICTLEANLIAGEESEIFFGRLNHKGVTLNKNLSCEVNRSCAECGLERIDFNLDCLTLTLGLVINNNLEGAENSHCTGCIFIKIIFYAGFKQTVVNNAVCF